ncbi:unnamed protein product [Oikopleura dioica]|uniref:EGF-like domain-containing protein n=1 Tax=Oikopleura dioica TaxID=34765 RepID=E4XDD8_OIKDI|nr:unnamed protein product [Oikopleura dioica]
MKLTSCFSLFLFSANDAKEAAGLNVPFEIEILGGKNCLITQGTALIAKFATEVFVHNTVITIPVDGFAKDYKDYEVKLDHPDLKKPVRCGSKFSSKYIKKQDDNTIEFYCKGVGKTKHLGRLADEAKVFIKKNKVGQCVDFSGVEFHTVQEDLAVWSDWSAWGECFNDVVNRTRSCEGIFCEELIEIESNPQPCLICEDGFEANEDDTECIDVNECVDDSACPLNSLCTNTEGSFTCECEDGLFGDDYNFCIEQRACHPAGEGDCDCQTLDVANSTFVTNIWNSTDSNCFYELSVQLPQFDVNSWKVNIDWTSQMSIHGLWRAQTDEAKATTHELQATYFNVDEMMDFTIQIKSEIACSLENPINELILCTEEIESESRAIESTTMELMTTVVGEPLTFVTTSEPPLNLSEESCDLVSFESTNVWSEGDGIAGQYKISFKLETAAYEWSIILPIPDDSEVAPWTSKYSEGVLTSNDWNEILQPGANEFGMIIRSTEFDEQYAEFCFKTILE